MPDEAFRFLRTPPRERGGLPLRRWARLDRRAARLRRTPPPALPLSELTTGMGRSMRKADRALSAALEFWKERDEFDVTEIAKLTLTRGTLSVHVPNACARYVVSQAMRCGLERETIQRTNGVSQIRVKG